MNKTPVYTGAVLVKVERSNEMFKSQELRIIREMVLATSENKDPIPPKHVLQITLKFIKEFNETLVRNNRALNKLRRERANQLKLDPTAYANEIQEAAERESNITLASENVRNQVYQMNKLVSQLNSDMSTWSKTTTAHYKKISDVYRLRESMRKVVRDKELFDWIIKDTFKDVDDFRAYLTKNSINEQESIMKDFAESTRVDIIRFREQVKLMKPFIKNRDEILYEELVKFETNDLKDISDAVNFIRMFKKFYLTVNTVEEYLMIEGITDELTESMDAVITIAGILNRLELGTSEESMESVQTIINASIAENEKFVEVSHALARVKSHEILGIDLDECSDEDLYKYKTFVLSALFHLLDIRGGSSALTLMARM